METQDIARSTETAKVERDGVPYILLPRDPNHEFLRVMQHAVVEKRDDRYADYLAMLKAKGLTGYEPYAKAAKDIKPWEVVEGDYNAMVNGGIDLALDLLIGAGGTSYVNATAYLGVGSSTLVANATYTGLQTQIVRVQCTTTWPSRAARIVTFKSDFAGAVGDGAWQEWGVFNNVSAGTMLSRKVEYLGTKSGGTWTLTTTFTFA